MLAEVTVREIGRIRLDESLALTALIALKDPRRRSRVAARWLLRLLEEHQTATIEEAALAASALAALGGSSHDDAYATLTAIAARAERRSRQSAGERAISLTAAEACAGNGLSSSRTRPEEASSS